MKELKQRKSTKMSSDIKKRSHNKGCSDKDKAKFQLSWTELFPFIQPVFEDRYHFHCAPCQKAIPCFHQGRFDLVRHMRGTRHKMNMLDANISSKVTPGLLRKAQSIRFPTRYLYEFEAQRSMLTHCAIASKPAAVVFDQREHTLSLARRGAGQECSAIGHVGSPSKDLEEEELQREMAEYDYVFAEEVDDNWSEGEMQDSSQVSDNPDKDVPGTSYEADLQQAAASCKYIVLNQGFQHEELPAPTRTNKRRIKLEKNEDSSRCNSILSQADYMRRISRPAAKSLIDKEGVCETNGIQGNGYAADGQEVLQKERGQQQGDFTGFQIHNPRSLRVEEDDALDETGWSSHDEVGKVIKNRKEAV